MCDGCNTMSMDAYGTTEHAAQIHEEMEAEFDRQQQQAAYEEQQWEQMMEQRDSGYEAGMAEKDW